jgi:hypothetical protein
VAHRALAKVLVIVSLYLSISSRSDPGSAFNMYGALTSSKGISSCSSSGGDSDEQGLQHHPQVQFTIRLACCRLNEFDFMVGLWHCSCSVSLTSKGTSSQSGSTGEHTAATERDSVSQKNPWNSFQQEDHSGHWGTEKMRANSGTFVLLVSSAYTCLGPVMQIFLIIRFFFLKEAGTRKPCVGYDQV